MTFPKRIVIETIPHGMQRYDTLGDYWEESDTWQVRLSELSDPRAVAAVLLHELVEMILTCRQGINWKAVDAFDLANIESADPGNEPTCPYREAHRIAESVETLLLASLGMSLGEYEGVLAEVDPE